MAGPFGGFADEDEPPKQKSFGDKLSETNIAKVLKGIFGAVTLPGDVAQGKVDPLSDEAIGRSADLAGIVSGGGSMASRGMVPGKVGRMPGKPELGEITTPRGSVPENLSPAGEAHVAEFGAQAEAQSGSAAERIARGFDPQGGMVAGSQQEGMELMQHGMRRAAEIEQEQVGKDFTFATKVGEKPGALHADAVMSMPQQVTKDLMDRRISTVKAPLANAMLKTINREVNALTSINKGVPTSGRVTNVTLGAVDKVKRDLNRYRRAAFESKNPEDIKATQAIMESFDQQIDALVNSKKFNGDPRAVEAWNVARERESVYRKNFESDGRRSVGEVADKIIGENPHDPKSLQAIANHFYGSIGVNPPRFNASVVNHVKGVLGENSPEWAGARQGTFMNLVSPKPGEWAPSRIKTRILDFLDGKGRETANALYSPQERAVMRQFANIHGTLDLTRGAEGGVAQTSEKVSMAAAGLIMGRIGIAAKLAHQGLSSASARMVQNRELRDLQEKLPIVRKAVENWKREIDRANKAPSGKRQITYAATVSLANTLRKQGMDPGGRLQITVNRRPEGEDKLSSKRAFGGPHQF
jgi:hypothetical protein